MMEKSGTGKREVEGPFGIRWLEASDVLLDIVVYKNTAYLFIFYEVITSKH